MSKTSKSTGLNIATCGGSVRFIDEGISYQALSALLMRDLGRCQGAVATSNESQLGAAGNNDG